MSDEKKTYKFVCVVCYVCPVCGVGPDQFELVEE